MTPKTIDPVARLAELERVRDAARQAEQVARDEHADRLRAVPAARAALTQAHASGEGIVEAERAFTAAQKAASDPSAAARAEGLATRTRTADAAVRAHIEANLSELVEEIRPRADQAVASIRERAADLREALADYYAVHGEIGRRTAHVRWFSAWERMPQAPLVDELGRVLDPCRLDDVSLLPVPMPKSTESPAEGQARLQREHDESAARAAVAA